MIRSIRITITPSATAVGTAYGETATLHELEIQVEQWNKKPIYYRQVVRPDDLESRFDVYMKHLTELLRHRIKAG